MKSRVMLLAVALAQCQGGAAPVQSPAPSPAAGAAASREGTGPGPAVGTSLPVFEASDQDGKRQSFETLRGPNGLLLNFNRSVVW